MGQPAHIEMVDSIYYEFDDRSGPVRIVALDVTLPGNEQPWRNPRRHRGDPPRKSGSHRTPRWEEDGFEPSVPRDTTNLLMATLVGSPPPKNRSEREPDAGTVGPFPAEPMVRIRLPPAGPG